MILIIIYFFLALFISIYVTIPNDTERQPEQCEYMQRSVACVLLFFFIIYLLLLMTYV